MRGNQQQHSTNLMHPPMAPAAPVFRGKLAEILQEIAEQSAIVNKHWNNSSKVDAGELPHYDFPVSANAHYAYAVPAKLRGEKLVKEAGAFIAAKMNCGGYNFRNAKPYSSAYINGIKLYWNDDESKFADVLRQHMPEDVQWMAHAIAGEVSDILRKR